MISGTAENRASTNGGQRKQSPKMVGKSGFWTCVLDFLAVFPARYAEPAGILKLRAFSRIDLPCIDICYNTLPIQYLWLFKARGHTSGAPGIRKKTCSSGLNELNLLVCVSVFRPFSGFLTKNHVVKSAENLSFLQLLRLQSKTVIAISA